MPELPEVETTKRGIAPHLISKRIKHVILRQKKLRWPIPNNLNTLLQGETILDVTRRAKYIFIECANGCLMIHLGMSGSLRIVDQHTPVEKHDHVDLVLSDNKILRYRDPRRFGAMLWHSSSLSERLLSHLGPEPLSRQFNAKYLHNKLTRTQRAIKLSIMDNDVVVGVGNIYATEALFLSGIHPAHSSNSLSLAECDELCRIIKQVLRKAIRAGGTTLKDFIHADGKPGYFQQKLFVYGRSGEACFQCGQTIDHLTLGQRRSAFCSHCQPL